VTYFLGHSVGINLMLIGLLARLLHLITPIVTVIVWRLTGNIIKTVLYIANVLPLQWAQLTKTVQTARLDLESFYVFRLHDVSLCWCMFCFTLDS